MDPRRRFRLLDLSSGSMPGRGISCAPGATTELLDLRATDADNAAVATVQVTPVLQQLGATDWPAARVKLQWGVHGATHEVLADLSTGFSATLCADFVRVAVVYPASVPNRIPATGPALQVNASAAWGTKSGSSGSPRLTTFLPNIPAGAESTGVELPNYTRAVGVLGAPLPPLGGVTPDVHLRFYGIVPGGPGALIAEAIDALHMSNEWGACTVPLGARFASLQNNEPANAIQRPALICFLGI